MMKEGVTVTIGGVEYFIPRMRFKQLKLAWPYVAQINKLGQQQFPPGENLAGEPIFMELHARKLQLMIEIISAAGLQRDPKLTADFMESNLDLEETRLLPEKFNELLSASGFELGNVPAEPLAGEAAPEAPQPAMTSTGTTSLQNLFATASAGATGSE